MQATGRVIVMSLFCRIGFHRWSFSSEFLDEPWRRAQPNTRTEVIRARCRRDGCTRYGDWSLIHRETHVVVEATRSASARAA